MKSKAKQNLENIAGILISEMEAYTKNMSTPETSYTIKSKELEWLPKTNPGIDMIRVTYTLESKTETRQESRVIKQFLERGFESRRFNSGKDAARFETDLLKEYHDAGGKVPLVYTTAGSYWEKGVVIMQDLGKKSLRDFFFELQEKGDHEGIYKLFDRGYTVLDRLHEIAVKNRHIQTIVSKAPSLDLDKRMAVSYRLLVAPEKDPAFPADFEGERNFLQAAEVIIKYVRGRGKPGLILRDTKPCHFLGEELLAIDFGRSGYGFWEEDEAGLAFSDLPLPIDQALEIYKRHYHQEIKTGSRSVARLISAGIIKDVATAAYVNRLKTLHPEEFDNLREKSPPYVRPSLYQERVKYLMLALPAYIQRDVKPALLDRAEAAFNQVLTGSAVELNRENPMKRSLA